MPGYIKLYRDLQDNWIWQDKPFSKGQAWADMILRCNHKCKKVRDEWVLRGQFQSSNYKLAEAWGWSESSVRQFVKMLVKDKMLLVLSTRHYSLYDVTNYCVYQSEYLSGLEEIPNAQKTHRKRTLNAQAAPNNNEDNDKNIKDIYMQPPTIEQVKSYCLERKNSVDPEKWHDFYTAKNWMIGKNKMKDWKAAVRTWEHENKPPGKQAPQAGNFTQRPIDNDLDSFYKEV